MSAVAELDREPKAAGNPSAEPAGSPSETGPVASASSESSGVGATRGGRATAPSEDQLLDVLYEVLVQGVPPRSTLTREDVEQFLHQHARQTKPIDEMLAFFEQHGLPTEPREYGADRELGELATGLQRERNSLMPGFGPAEPAEPPPAQQLPQTYPPAVQPAVAQVALSTLTAASAALENEKTGRRAAPVARASRGLRWLVSIASLLALSAVVAFALNYKRSTSLEQRLDQARMQQRSTDVALTKLEQRAEGLQVSLQQSEEERRQQAAALQTTIEAQAKQRATEEQAIERVLGPRYLKLRQKFSDQASGVVPPTGPALKPAAALRRQAPAP